VRERSKQQNTSLANKENSDMLEGIKIPATIDEAQGWGLEVDLSRQSGQDKPL
jgi:hypothetical protein